MKNEELSALLEKILALPSVRADIEEMKADPEFFEGYTDFQFEDNALYNFFEDDYEEIFKVEEIWRLVRENVREEVEWRTTDLEAFLKHGLDFEVEEYVRKLLEDLHDDLYKVLKQKHGKQ